MVEDKERSSSMKLRSIYSLMMSWMNMKRAPIQERDVLNGGRINEYSDGLGFDIDPAGFLINLVTFVMNVIMIVSVITAGLMNLKWSFPFQRWNEREKLASCAHEGRQS